MKTKVTSNMVTRFAVRCTALFAAATILIGPAAAADPQMLTNTSLPVTTLSEKQTRRLLSGANLKAKMKTAMRFGKRPVETPALAMTTATAAPPAVSGQLRGPIAETGAPAATSETTAPGWSEEPDPLAASTTATPAPVATAAPVATPAQVATAAPVSTPSPVATAAPVSIATSPIETSSARALPALVAPDTAAATGAAVSPAATVDATTTTAAEAPSPTTGTAATKEATGTTADASAITADATTTDATATTADAAGTNSDTTKSATPTQRIGEFNVESLAGGNLLKSEIKPSDGVVAMSTNMDSAVITSSPGFLSDGSDGGPIVIDNDEIIEQNVTIAYEEMPTEAGGTAVKAGARFPVVMLSEINSKTAKKGDPIEARLKYDLKIGTRHIANKGSRVRGHLNYVLRARTVLGSMVTTQRFYRNSGVLGIAFDELINENGEHFALVAKPAMMDRIVKNKYEGRELGVNHNGQVTGPFSQQLRYKAIRVGMNFAMAPLGTMSFGAMPVALGVMGAINPSFAFMRPVGLNVRHRRIKGFAWGFLSGIPGSWLIEDTTVRGQEAIIKPGDEFLAVFNEQFKGEAATDASLLPGGGTKVRGEVLSGVKEPTKKKKGK